MSIFHPTSLLTPQPALAVLIPLLVLALPAGAVGQQIDHENVEIIRPPAKAVPLGKSPDLARVAKLIVEKTNQFRRQEGLPEVEVNPKLAEAADSFARYMARTNRYGHTADGSRPADRASKHGYDYCIVAENIAYLYSTEAFTAEALAEKFVQGWKDSPGHRKNMLDPDVTDTGVAVARAEDTGYYYAVQDFGRPKSKGIEFQVANESDATVRYEIGGQGFSLPPRHTRIHQVCRPAELRMKSPDVKDDTPVMKPANGDRFVISKEEGQFRLKKG